MVKKLFHPIIHGLKLFFGPDLAMISWKILLALGLFVLLSLIPSLSQNTLFCGDYGYPFVYAEGYGLCSAGTICQDFYPLELVYAILISYALSCMILTMWPLLVRLIKTVR